MLSRLLTVREQLILAGLAASIVAGSLTMYSFHRAAPAPAPAILPVMEDRSTPPEKPPGTVAPPPVAPAASPSLAISPIASPPSVTPPVEPVSDQRVGVGIIGAVNRPGMYYLEPGARVTHLIRAAGGVTEEADLSDINQAAHLIDATTLAIPVSRRAAREGLHKPQSSIDPAEYNPAPYTLSRACIASPAPVEEEAPFMVGGSLPVPGHADGRVDLNSASQDDLEALPGIGKVLAGRIIEFRAHTPFTAVDDLRQVEGIGEKKLETVRPLVIVNPL